MTDTIIELPPLPSHWEQSLTTFVLNWGKAAIAADRQRRREPVAYAVFADNGNIRLWSSKPLDNPDAVPLYAGPQHVEKTKTSTLKTIQGISIQFEPPKQIISSIQTDEGSDNDVHEWMLCETRRPWVVNSLKKRSRDLRIAEELCRDAFKKDFMGRPSNYFADICGKAASIFEDALSSINSANKERKD